MTSSTYQPQDDYSDGDLALMDEHGPWPQCRICGWSPDWSDKPHAEFVAESTFATDHAVQVDPADLAGNDERSNYAEASAAHAAINTADLPRAVKNIDQARDNYDATWKAVQDAKQAVKDAQAAADQAEIAWGDASATLQRFERDAVAARAGQTVDHDHLSTGQAVNILNGLGMTRQAAHQALVQAQERGTVTRCGIRISSDDDAQDYRVQHPEGLFNGGLPS
jgi:hypothetical protein